MLPISFFLQRTGYFQGLSTQTERPRGRLTAFRWKPAGPHVFVFAQGRWFDSTGSAVLETGGVLEEGPPLPSSRPVTEKPTRTASKHPKVSSGSMHGKSAGETFSWRSDAWRIPTVCLSLRSCPAKASLKQPWPGQRVVNRASGRRGRELFCSSRGFVPCGPSAGSLGRPFTCRGLQAGRPSGGVYSTGGPVSRVPENEQSRGSGPAGTTSSRIPLRRPAAQRVVGR